MSKKRRVFQVARELSLSNEAVIDFLVKLDKTVHTQMSAVSDDLYTEICTKYKVDESSVETPQDFRKQLKEKQMLEELRRNKARLDLEERLRFATQLAEEKPERTKKAAAAKKAEEEAEILKKESEKEVEVVDITTTSVEEQRPTEWMPFESLPHALNPQDATKTIEGYPAPKWRSDWKWQRLQPHLETLAGRNILDVGCGNGYVLSKYADEGAEVSGVDITQRIVVGEIFSRH